MERVDADESSVRPPLEKAWEFEAGDGIEPRLPWGTQALVAAHGMVFFGSSDKHIYSLEVASGKERWRFKMDKKIKFPLLVSDDMLYVASDDKNLHAVDVQTGKSLWQFSTGKDVQHRPVMFDGIVYVVTKDENLYALDGKTGQERWRFFTGKGLSSPGVGQGLVFLGSGDRSVYALDAISGAKKWESKSGHKKHSPPVVAKDVVLISGDKDLHAFNVDDGSLMWVAKEATSGDHRVPVVAKDFVISPKEVTILNLTNGEVLVKLASGSGPDERGRDNIGVSEGIIYVRLGGTMYAVNLATRGIIWTAPINPGAFNTTWTLGEEFVFVATDNKYGKLCAINISRFMKRWESGKLSERVFDRWGAVIGAISPPLIVNGKVIVSCGKRVTAFRSSKDPDSQSLLEVGDEVASSPKYTSIQSLRQLYLGDSAGLVVWPKFCCLCLGPAEKSVNLKQRKGDLTYSVRGIPYCSNCLKKTKSLIGRAEEEPGVKIAKVTPPTLAFRNEKYWAMFMEANHLK